MTERTKGEEIAASNDICHPSGCEDCEGGAFCKELAHQIDSALAQVEEETIKRCADELMTRAAALGRQKCCGECGLGCPPECCADPDFMIADREIESHLKSLPRLYAKPEPQT